MLLRACLSAVNVAVESLGRMLALCRLAGGADGLFQNGRTMSVPPAMLRGCSLPTPSPAPTPPSESSRPGGYEEMVSHYGFEMTF